MFSVTKKLAFSKLLLQHQQNMMTIQSYQKVDNYSESTGSSGHKNNQ